MERGVIQGNLGVAGGERTMNVKKQTLLLQVSIKQYAMIRFLCAESYFKINVIGEIERDGIKAMI